MAMGDRVLSTKRRPDDYHCDCDYCSKFIGELRPPDGSYYSRLERRSYYAPEESGEDGHIAKTPLHIARWAVQQYTKPKQWVLDPTAGAGTTAVEAITQGRNFAGMELQYGDVIRANIRKHLIPGIEAAVRVGDAREIRAFLKEKLPRQKFHLIVNNPPYSGDESMPSPTARSRGNKEFRHEEVQYKYKDGLPNLAFLKESSEYWETIGSIYAECIRALAPGGHFVVGVKDMSKRGEPFLLHKMYADALRDRGLTFVGTAVLKHHPRTMHLNSCFKRLGYHPPYYQTITVFQKRK